jgi:DNA-binding HxlR family transcriptional regulator
MALLDLLGRRTCLRILWELRNGPLSFRALADAAATNPGVLNTRLAELREARIIETSAAGYTLTADGKKLLDVLNPLSKWAEQWADHLE